MSKAKIFVTAYHPGSAIDDLSRHYSVEKNANAIGLNEASLREKLKDCQAIISAVEDPISKTVLMANPQLKVIAQAAVGFDNIDIQTATELGIVVTNTAGVLTETCADLAFGLLLTCARRISEGDRFIRAHKWKGFTPDLMLGLDVFGKTLGIVGFGRIGQAVARRAAGFSMNVLYTRSGSFNVAPGIAKQVSLAELLSLSDYVSLHCPLSKETINLIGEKELAMMKPTACLINTARGKVVEQVALVKALKSGQLKAAALDVFQDEPNVPDELISMEQVVLTPHIASASVETREAMARCAVDNLLLALSGKMPPHMVNPNVWDRFCQRIN